MKLDKPVLAEGETFIDPDDLEDDGWAWFQNFFYGYQNHGHKYGELRARAVRRVYVEEERHE